MAAVRRHLSTVMVALVLVCGAAGHGSRPGYATFSAEPYDEEIGYCSNRSSSVGRLVFVGDTVDIDSLTEVSWIEIGKSGNHLQYVRHVHSMFDAYRGDVGGRLIIETNALINTKYRTWKRNADIINSLLALPKGMNDAGR